MPYIAVGHDWQLGFVIPPPTKTESVSKGHSVVRMLQTIPSKMYCISVLSVLLFFFSDELKHACV